MSNYLENFILKGEEYERLAQQERLIINVAEDLWEQKEAKGTTLEHLAEVIGKTKGYLSRLLTGNANMTLRTLSDLAFSMDCEVDVRVIPKYKKLSDIQLEKGNVIYTHHFSKVNPISTHPYDNKGNYKDVA